MLEIVKAIDESEKLVQTSWTPPHPSSHSLAISTKAK